MRLERILAALAVRSATRDARAARVVFCASRDAPEQQFGGAYAACPSADAHLTCQQPDTRARYAALRWLCHTCLCTRGYAYWRVVALPRRLIPCTVVDGRARRVLPLQHCTAAQRRALLQRL